MPNSNHHPVTSDHAADTDSWPNRRVEPPVPQQEKVSTTDSDSTYATKGGPEKHVFPSGLHSLHGDRGLKAMRREAALYVGSTTSAFGPITVNSEEFQLVFGAVFASELQSLTPDCLSLVL